VRRDIFVSYRREDSAGESGRLFDDLVREFGEESVFMDVDGIGPGMDFRKAIEENVSSCGVFLAVIGPEWTTIKDGAGGLRLENINDFVRLEIATALARNIAVIPVLVHGASMPKPEQLPENLKELAYRNSVEISHTHWNSDVALLLKALTQYVTTTKATSTSPVHATLPVQLPPPVSAGSSSMGTRAKWPWIVSAVAVVVVLGVVGYLMSLSGSASGTVNGQGATTQVAVQRVPTAAVEAMPGTQAPVALDGVANVVGLAVQNTKFDGPGIDGAGWAYPARALGTAIEFGGVTFVLGKANQNDMVAGAVNGPIQIALPGGHFARLMMLGLAVNGAQASVPFTVLYGDGTKAEFVQGMSDWAAPQSYAGEIVAKQVARRNHNDGTEQQGAYSLYGYALPLDPSKSVSALVVPANPSVVIAAMTLSGDGS